MSKVNYLLTTEIPGANAGASAGGTCTVQWATLSSSHSAEPGQVEAKSSFQGDVAAVRTRDGLAG